ncbi:translocation/assembly module TamB domain-containing protein [Pontibacter sp. JH31]|uniref:Translocation/assembly module TamB domain-containing protein n=2 Tax=Pontibacter aquaedesilientis TaxID=2766980 RepID=A0ABR7XH18_9BACT|nr:translocation/assembly module TamB domain-containing protein [Pontibacter aquaedesilientis]MBD1397594.1 translocation/assembly module TamB domain-containing protein [Pontibacter aquaedesilientis]
MALILLLLVAFAVVFVAIRYPGVQTKVAQKAAEYISSTIDHEVTIGRVDIEFFSNVILEQVKVLDYRGEELFYVGRAEADISLFSIFQPNTLGIATLELQEPRANLVMYEGTDSLNLTSFITALGNLITKDTTKVSRPFEFSIDELVIKDGAFTYDDFNKPRSDYGIDYFHLGIKKISARFTEFEPGDTLKVRVTDLTAHETLSDIQLHNLDVLMTYAPTFWEWDELDLKVNNSNLQQYIRFDYNRFGNFSDFIDSVQVTARLQDSQLYSKDIALFAPQLKDYDENAYIASAEVEGRVSEFIASNLDLRYGQNTHIVGTMNVDGLPNWGETFANIRLRPSTLNAEDIKQFLPKDTYTIASRLGTVKVDGRFLGFYNDFVANGSFVTALGNVQSDINMKINRATNASSYRGRLKTQNFNIGRLIDNTDVIKTITMDGSVVGSGFTLEDARLEIHADIAQLHLLDYNYRNIRTDGTLTRQKYVGQVAISDPNLAFTANGEVNLASNNQAFNMRANLQKIDLQALRITEKSVILQANADLNFRGLRLDDFEGTAFFDNAAITYEGQRFALDTMQLDSQIMGGLRNLTLRSEAIALNLNGNFDYSVLISDLKQLAQEYKLNFESNDAATAAYYSKKRVASQPEYSLDYNVYLRRVNPIIHWFVPELTISDFSKLEGSFRHGNTVILTSYAHIDTMLYNNVSLFQNNIELSTSKLQDSPEVLASAQFTSDNQLLPSIGETEQLLLEAIWSERTIGFYTNLLQPAFNNQATVVGDINFLQDRLQVVFGRSNITLRDTPWAFQPGSMVYISESGKRFDFEEFILSNKSQQIRIDGAIGQDPGSTLLANVRNFDLRNFNPLMPQQVRGTLNAELTAQDIYNNTLLNATMRVDSFYMDDILIGDINGKGEWINAQQQMAIDVDIDRDSKKVLTLTGNYYPRSEEEQLDMLAVLDETQLKIVEPILKPIMSELEGTMEGRIRVLGKLSAPVLTGSVMVTGGQFKFDYLGTTYRFTDRVYFGANSISFRNAQLRDLYGNIGYVTGGIAHDGFRNMVLDLNARFRNLMILNTTNVQNELYYGTAFGTGTASVLGPVENLKIDVNARSDANTRIVIPLDNQTDLARKDFIRFVNRNVTDSTGIAVEVEEQRVDLSGINMNFNLDVTDDAYFEIIIDRQTGDVIRGSGSGQIRMTIDTRGDFNMFGNFEIAKGAYNLNLLEGVVSREFRVTPGGTLSWNGDPLEGVMDIRATYTQNTAVDILQNSEVQGRYPVTAIVDLKGPILTPTITLGLDFENLPASARLQLESIIQAIRTDENELNRQVFSLLVLRRLAPIGYFGSLDNAGIEAVGGSLGNLLTGQLGGFLNTIDSNLEIDIGLEGLSQDALASLQLRLSYTFFEGRLRVSSQTGIGSTQTSQAGGASRNTYQGNWSIEYYITKSGELRGRLEYNTIPDPYRSRVTNTQRLSLLHTKRFDTLQELFGRDRESRRERRREQYQEPIILDSDPRLNL